MRTVTCTFIPNHDPEGMLIHVRIDDDGALRDVPVTEAIHAAEGMPPLVRAVRVEHATGWDYRVVDIDTDDTIGRMTVLAGAGA